jgi:hypothetical protein
MDDLIDGYTERKKEMRVKADKAARAFKVFFIATLVLGLTLLGTGLYVAWHFLSKVW